MKTAERPKLLLPLLILLLAVAVLAIWIITGGKEEFDPHEGQVYIYDGFDWIWMTPLEGVEPNPMTQEDFSLAGSAPVYLGSLFQTRRCIDVSEHQYGIDWQQVKASGVDGAFIRIGRRGYTEGGLFNDPWYQPNMDGALAAGMEVGVYFFSQAVSVQEALEEADFVLERLQGYRVTLPVVYDWEKIPGEASARTNGLSMTTRTDCAVAFCEKIKAAGYTPGVYFNRNLGYYGYDLTRLTDYFLWFALPESPWPSFYYAMDMWQYSFTEAVPGVEGETDMNLLFIPVATPSPEPTT